MEQERIITNDLYCAAFLLCFKECRLLRIERNRRKRISLINISKGRTPQSVKDEGLPELKQMFKNFAIIEEAEKGEMPYWYSFSYSSSKNYIKSKQYIIIKNNTAYILTFAATNSTYNNYRFQFNQILNSFKITN